MTRDEIVAALRRCASGSGCGACPRQDVPEAIEDCGDGLSIAAADLIENQRREIEALRQANEGLRFNLAALHGSGGHPDPVGKKGQMAECPVCGGMCSWTPETDVSICRVCGYTNGKEFDGVSVDRLRVLAEADRTGRVAILPCAVGGAMLDVSDPEHPREMKDVHFSVSYVSSGIVFSQPLNIFRQNIAAGYIKSLEVSNHERKNRCCVGESGL